MGVTIHASMGSNLTLQKFSEILSARMKYLNETARQSSAACMIDTLKSLRPVTRVFKKSSIKVKVTVDKGLYPSFSKSNGSSKPCIRVTGSGNRYNGEEKVIWPMIITKQANVFRFIDEYSKNQRKYLIVSNTLSDATKKAKEIVYKRAVRYEKLAKSALGVSMKKVGDTTNINDFTNLRVRTKSNEITTVTENVHEDKSNNGGTYSLTVNDNLNGQI